MFFTKKYIKIPIALLVMVSLLLQFAPSAEPAQAGFVSNALNWLQNKLSKVSLPNIDITDEGALKLGNWTLFDCLSKDCECVKWEDPPEPEPLDLDALLAIANTEYLKQYGDVDMGCESGCETCASLLFPQPDFDGSVNDLCAPPINEEEINPWMPACIKCEKVKTCMDTINNMKPGGPPWDIPLLQKDCKVLGIEISNSNGGEVIPESERKCEIEVCGDCEHPFEDLRLKVPGTNIEFESQKPLLRCVEVDDEGECVKRGGLNIPEVNFPPQCGLKIPMPSDDEKMTTEQQLAQRKACTAVMRIQKEAATQVFLAKKMFNNTDPFTECLFVRNCRSSCAMKLGSFKYKISISDVAMALLPTGVITLIQKILNIKKMIGEVTKIVKAIKTLAKDGIAIFNNVIQVVHNVASFFEAASNTGIKMSDALIFGGGMLLSDIAGEKLKSLEFKTGVSREGKVGWFQKLKDLPAQAPGMLMEGGTEMAGWALTAGDGALGGAGLTMALNPERAKQGMDNLKDMLYNFAENNLKFSTAKSEALSLLGQIQQDSEIVRRQFKKEPEIAFLFDQNDRRKKLNKIKDEFLVTFETIDAFLGEMAQTGELKDGQTILTMPLGKDIIPDVPVNFEPSHLVDVPPGILPLKFAPLGTDDKYDDILVSYFDYKTTDGTTWDFCTFDSPMVLPSIDCSLLNKEFTDNPNATRGVLQGIIGGLPAYYPNAQQLYLAQPHWFISDLNNEHGACKWLDGFEEIYPKANYLRIFLDPDYVLEVVDKALGGYHIENNKDGESIEVYNMKLLNYTKGAWVDYWTTIRTIMGITSWYSLGHTMDLVQAKLPSFRHLKEIQTHSQGTFGGGQLADPNKFEADGGPRAWVKRKVSDYVAARNDAERDELKRMGDMIQGDLSSISESIEHLWWQRAGLLGEFNYRKQSSYAGMYEFTPYWSERNWSTPFENVPSCSFGGLGTAGIKSTYFDNSYDSDVMFSNWDGKIEILAKTAGGLDILREALDWGISPQDPVMVYRVEKAKRDIDEIISKADAALDDQTKAVVNQAIDDTIVDLQVKYDHLNSKYEYDNYVNCGACEKKNDPRNLKTKATTGIFSDNKSAVGQVNSKGCCGEIPEILCAPINQSCTNKAGTGWDAIDTLDNMHCEVGENKADKCYHKYKDGSDTCSGGPTPYVPVSWINNKNDCSKCKTSCVAGCWDTCTRDSRTYCDDWEQDDDGDWYCDDWDTEYKYKCSVNSSANSSWGSKSNARQTACDNKCYRNENCKTTDKCETNYCSYVPDSDGTGGGACWWEDYYKEQRGSFREHLNFYKDGFDDYVDFQNRVQMLECLREEFVSILLGQSDFIGDLKDELDVLKDKYLELHNIWQEAMDVGEGNYYESEVARAYVNKIIASKDKAMEIIGSGSPGSPENAESTLGHIQSSLDFLKNITIRFNKVITDSALDDATKDLLRNNFVAILNQFIDIVEKDIIEPIENNVGFYVASCNDGNCASGTCPPDLVCTPDKQYCKGDITDDVDDCVCTPQPGRITCTAEQKRCECEPEEKECPEKNGFLNRIKCFEKDVGRTFEQLLDFLDTLKNMEEVVLNIPLIEDTLVSIEPEFRMDPPQLQPDILDRTIGKAKACGIGLVPDAIEGLFSDVDKNKAKCEQKTSFFQTPGADSQDFGAFRKAILNNPLDSLEGKFNDISVIVDGRVKPALADNDEGALGLIKENTVFGKAADFDRYGLYEAALTDIDEEFTSLWWDFIWGKAEKQELRKACQAASLVIDNDPTDIEKSCTGPDVSLLKLPNFDNLKEKCEALAKVDLDEIDSLIAVMAELEERREDKKCIKTETCDDDSKHCLACPELFCQGSNDSKCCAVIGQDGSCIEHMPGYKDGAIWKGGAEAAPVEDDDRVKAAVCKDAGLPVDCIVSDLKSQCAEFKAKVVMDTFDVFDEQAQKMESINKLQDEMACIAYEDCSWGFNDTLSGFTLTTTDVSGDTLPCITCPKWICQNFDNDLITVDDPHCVVANGWEEGENMIWDDSWPSGLREWPRKTACLSEQGASLPTVYADRYSSKSLNWMTGQCIQKQTELKILLDETGGVTIEFPWETEGWPCQTKEACEKLETSCKSLEDGTAVPLSSGWNSWPPLDPCGTGDYQHHISLKSRCETNQEQIAALETAEDAFAALENMQAGLGGMLGADADGDGNQDIIGDISGLVHLCNGIAFQEAIQEECSQFYKLKGAFDDDACPGNDCDPGAGVVEPSAELRKTIGQFCNKNVVEPLPGGLKCSGSGVNARTNFDLTFNAESLFNGKPSKELSADELTKKDKRAEEASDARKEARKICKDSFSDMRTPLNEVMRVFSILLGIKNYTGAKAGMGGTWKVWDKNSGMRKDAEDLWGQATRIYTMIMGKKCPDDEECGPNGKCQGSNKSCSGNILKVLGDIWGEEDKGPAKSSGGFEVTPLMCESRPLSSYTSKGVEKTGLQGGPVCPDVSNFFSQMNAKFQLIRQYLRQIDLIRRNASVDLTLGGLKINIMDSGDIDPALNEVVAPLYDYAEGIKEKAQLLWAMSTAINFASENCTCGAKSYCPMIWKIPFCVSGLPSSVEPIKSPYCMLVWTLRFALGSLADVLHNDLENDFK